MQYLSLNDFNLLEECTIYEINKELEKEDLEKCFLREVNNPSGAYFRTAYSKSKWGKFLK